jgi:hypothetical protein
MNKQTDPFNRGRLAHFHAALHKTDPLFQQPLIQAVENAPSANAAAITAAVKDGVNDALTLEVERMRRPGLRLSKLRRLLDRAARIPGDVNAFEREPRTAAKRVKRRFVRRLPGKLLQKVTR